MAETDIESSVSEGTVPDSNTSTDAISTETSSETPSPDIDTWEGEGGATAPDEKTIEVTETELNELGEFLTAMREIILQHEGRLTALEEVIDKAVNAKPGIVLGKANSIKSR